MTTENIFKNILSALSKESSGDGNKNTKSKFVFEDQFALSDVFIHVEDVGHVDVPVKRDCINKLISVSSQAHFGVGEKTILDTGFRNSQVIPSTKLRVNLNEEALKRILHKMVKSVGLSSSSKLESKLHNLLIYGPGQFFDFHQDSEKEDNMVATLVLVLPSPHIGGNLIIKHNNETHTFVSENISSSVIKCIAFYADCMHKVEKIRDGYRVALVYNLILRPEIFIQDSSVNQNLKLAVQNYFSQASSNLPKLVFFLNHNYTQRSLRWDLLKGVDRTNLSMFRAVTDALDLLPYLALADVKETWECWEDIHEKPCLDYVLCEETRLVYWVDLHNKSVIFDTYDLNDKEICFLQNTNSFRPYREEYSGPTGNEGNTMDLWYRRAALVMWPRAKQLEMTLVLNYSMALKELCSLAEDPNNKTVLLQKIDTAGDLFYKNIKQTKCLFECMAILCEYISDSEKSLIILSHFQWKILDVDIYEHLAKLQIKYGIPWCLELLNKWSNRRPFSYWSRDSVVLDKIDNFASSYLHCQGDLQVIEFVLNVQCEVIMTDKAMDRQWKQMSLDSSVLKRIEEVQKICGVLLSIRSFSLIEKIIKYIISEPVLYPVINLCDLFFSLQLISGQEYIQHFNILKKHIVQVMEDIIKKGFQEQNDWSISVDLVCGCEHCGTVQKFLKSKTEKLLTLGLKANLRQHIIHRFEDMKLPITFDIEKRGSPHKLVCTKTDMLHENDKKYVTDIKTQYYRFISATV